MQKARRHPFRLRPLVSIRFQVLFHSVIHGAFHLSLTVLVLYRSLRSIQPYQMVLAVSDRITHVPPYSGYCQVYKLFQIQGYHLLWPNFPICSSIIYMSTSQSYNPSIAETTLVWAVSLSLAATQEITLVFSSSGYLDVSVLRVCAYCDMSSTYQVSPFGNLRVKSCLHLTVAYRSLSRPSSPLRAKASTVCPQ